MKMKNKDFEVIIIGGSYAGLSAAMALGRSLRNVLVIDGGNPCNKQTPHSHNFLTQDGSSPGEIASKAKDQVLRYNTVEYYEGRAVDGRKVSEGFEVDSEAGATFTAKKLIFATGIKDIMPDIPGFAECWGISVIHCPYCHGYEVKNEKTGILGNGEYGFEFSKMIHHWTKELTLFTNGKSTLSGEQAGKLKENGIPIVENEVKYLEHVEGQLQNVVFSDGSKTPLKAIYSKPHFVQHCNIPNALGCATTENGHLATDMFQKTTVPGVYACGDSATMMRSVANAVYSGSMAGAMANKELIEEAF